MQAQRKLKARIDQKLDQALQDSFPASDPVAFIDPLPVKDGDLELSTVRGTGQLPTSRTTDRPRRRRK